MLEATMTSKGQTTIPKAIRDYLHLGAGDRMTFTRLADCTVILRAKTKSIMELGGILKRTDAPAVPADEMTLWK